MRAWAAVHRLGSVPAALRARPITRPGVLSWVGSRRACGRLPVRCGHIAAVGRSATDVVVSWADDGHTAEFHPSFLRHNCPSQVEASSGQKLVPAAAVKAVCSIAELAIDRDTDTLTIVWDAADHHTSEFPGELLRRLSPRPGAGAMGSEEGGGAAAWAPWTSAAAALPELEFSDVVGSELGTFQWLDRLRFDGMCVLRGAPVDDVAVVDRLVGLISHLQPTIYGSTFDVRTEPNPINIAYTNLPLVLHQDLVYYESPPGLQLLHCLEFGEDVVGGEHVLLDAFYVAELLRVEQPDAFEALCQIPARFQKIHAERASPAKMTYDRPHITVNDDGVISQVTWSPPFEGPLAHTHGPVAERYYSAYAAFAALVEREIPQHQAVIPLAPGDVVTFNNRRMLHGRNGFTCAGPVARRHLRGAYCNIDEFKNRHAVLYDEFGPEHSRSATPAAFLPPVGNQDFSSVC